MDILPDGSLDYDDEILAQLDYVIELFIKALTNQKNKLWND